MNTSAPLSEQRYAIYHITMKKFMFMLRETPHGSPFTWMPSNGTFFTVSRENVKSFVDYLNKEKRVEIGTVCTWMVKFLQKEDSWENIMMVPLSLLEVGIGEANRYDPDYDHSFQLWSKNG